MTILEPYLDKRQQVTVVDGMKSKKADINAGCPQGSKLVPLLFLIYINDIQNYLESDILLFSDDTSLLARGIRSRGNNSNFEQKFSKN